MITLDPRDGAVPSLLGTVPLSSALLPLRTATAKAMSTLPLPALSPSDWGCRADTGLSGPGAPCGMSPWPCLSGQLWGFPHSHHQYGKHRIKLPGKRTPHGGVSPGLCLGLLGQSTTSTIAGLTALVRVMPGSPKAKREAQQKLSGRAPDQP